MENPLEALRPLARSNFLPLDLTYGLVVDPGVPGAFPKCLTASREFLGPINRTVFCPFGALVASWSRVMHSPPPFRIRARAVRVNRSAQTVNLGTSYCLASSVMVPTTTAIFFSRPSFDISRANRRRDTGGRLILLMNNRFRIILLNFAPVLLARYRYNCN